MDENWIVSGLFASLGLRFVGLPLPPQFIEPSNFQQPYLSLEMHQGLSLHQLHRTEQSAQGGRFNIAGDEDQPRTGVFAGPAV